MSQTTIAPFEKTIQTTNLWLDDIQDELGWGADHQQAYQALRAVLHALRDRLPVELAAGLAAQLPMLVRGIYYEGWRPHGKPAKERHKDDFLFHVLADFRNAIDVDPEEVTRAVFQVLSTHLSPGEIDTVKQSLPAEVRKLWDGCFPARRECDDDDTELGCGRPGKGPCGSSQGSA